MDLRLWPAEWYSGWILQQFPGLAYYFTLAFCAISIAVVAVAVLGIWRARQARHALHPVDDTTSSAGDKGVLQAFWFLGLLQLAYYLPSIAVSTIDVASNLLRVKPSPGDDNAGARLSWWSIISIPYVCLVCVVSLMVVPAIQILYVKRRLLQLRSKGTLHQYIPHARLVSTIVGIAWNAAFYCMEAFWLPHTTAALWKYIIVQGALGSAFTWYAASDICTLHPEKLERQHELVCHGAWGGTAVLFANPDKIGDAGDSLLRSV